MVILALALLAGLFGWTMRMVTLPFAPFHTSVNSSHTVAWICPPPPRIC
ncbi:MAG: hypothetical protein NVS3B14_18050 [Ktedonobacteraceae bacterium]